MVKLHCTLVKNPAPNLLSASLIDANGVIVFIFIMDFVMTSKPSYTSQNEFLKFSNSGDSFNLKTLKLSTLENVT
jgi:hypothetical protein